MPIEEYKRIACGVYDQFELLAMRQKVVVIKYRDASANSFEEQDVIVNLKTIEKVEYAFLKSGLKIRLDWIIQLDDLVIQDQTDCNL